MPIINSITSPAPAIITTVDTTGNLVFQNAGTTNLILDTNQNAIHTGYISAPNTFGFKNRLINSAMVIDQRNAGASVTPAIGVSTYTLDRWSIYVSQSSKLTAQQSSTAPTGFVNSVLVTSSSAYSVVAADQFEFRQFIEGFNVADLGWGTANAQTVTLSFWVRSSLTGTFGGALRNSASDRSYVFSYSISSANTWEQKTVTIAGDTSGTWLTTTGRGIGVFFSLGAGSTSLKAAGSWGAGEYVGVTGQTNLVGTSGATFYITGVQLEKGSTATSFDYRPYGTELALCQRYFFLSDSTAGYAYYGSSYQSSGNQVSNYFYYPVPMRTTATITSNGTWSLVNCTGPSTIADLKGYIFYVTFSATGAGSIRSGSSAYLTFSAEL